MTDNPKLAARLEDMEARLAECERKLHSRLWESAVTEAGDELVSRYGERVNKTVAAEILDVTRATVYAMLADGRLCA